VSLRLKLIISFIAASLSVVIIFGMVAYTSARDYTRHIELSHLHKNNASLIDMLKEKSTNLAAIRAMIPHHEDGSNSFLVIDLRTNEIVYGSGTELKEQLLATLNRQTTEDEQDNDGSFSGSFSSNDKEVIWSADTLPGERYLIVNSYQRDQNDVSTFLEFIATPLGITLFIGIWLALWVSAILANLFRRIADQNTQLEFQARHDQLTALPNRSAISDILQARISNAELNREKIIFCLVDINALKEVNDSLGHETGDILLRQVAERLQETVRASDQIGRFGGNKFAIILNHAQSDAIESICNKLLANFESIFEIKEHSLYVRVIIGVTIFPDHANNAPALIQRAETALHKAKRLAMDFVIYDEASDNTSAQRLGLIHDLRNAIHNDELELYYQPQLDMHHGVITSVEALARWIHPQHGFIPPDVFIDIAERTGLIGPLTDWVLRTAVEQCARWKNMGKSIKISVNLSTYNLHDETLGEQISNLITYWGITPDLLCLEITETAMMQDPEHAKKILKKLDNIGFRISIDDFGTGYSSLGYLKQLPLDELKIDKSFVINMSHDENDASIVRATVGLAHDIGLEVVAEGVEDQDAQNELKRLGCEYIQGYHIGRPMPEHDLTLILMASKASNDEHQPDNTLLPPKSGEV
jgi:diguanylate cyclase (GGDEF)-like protein